MTNTALPELYLHLSNEKVLHMLLLLTYCAMDP